MKVASGSPEMSTPINYYEVLEIPSDASEREIKRAYYRLARDLHPDKAAAADQIKAFEERFSQVSAAYNTLKDRAKRAEHDKLVQKMGATPTPAPVYKSAVQAVLTAGRETPRPGNLAAGARESGSGRPPALGLTPEKISIAQKAYVRGLQCHKENNFRKAIELFEAAIQNNNTEAIYHSHLAMALIQSRRSATRAIESAQRASLLDPYNIEHKLTLAFIFETIGSTSNAQKVYEDILRWDSDNKQARLCLDSLKKGKRKGFALIGAQLLNGQNFFKQLLARFRK